MHVYRGLMTTGRDCYHMVFEVLDNCIDEAMAGHCSEIFVKINKDESVTVEDNGRGIPVDVHKKRSFCSSLILTTLHSGGNYDNSYKVSGGLLVLVCQLNALSKKLI